MSLISTRIVFNNLTRIFTEPNYTSFRGYAARKGTRERKMKKKTKKVVVEKVKFISHNERNREQQLALRPKLKFSDSWKAIPKDDVYVMKYFRWPVYSFKEAVENHRETHHPDMYNVPNAPLIARIELNMQGEKITRFVDDFHSTVPIPAKFDHGEERAIIAFAKTSEAQQEAAEKGAHLTGGVELIKQIQAGTVSLKDFQYIIAHPDILPELVTLRGLMKRRFPSTKLGTLGIDLGEVTEAFLNGILYKAKKDEYEKDFGLVETKIGTLDMDLKGLEGNFAALVKNIESMRPKREGEFISRCLLLCAPSSEKFKVNHEVYLENAKKSDEDSDNEDKGVRVAL